MDTVADLLVNVAANFIFWIGLGLAVAAYARTAQRRFRRFFGLDRNDRLSTCVSNLWTESMGSRPRGYAISLHELRASETVGRLFSSSPFKLPELVRGLVDAAFAGRSASPPVTTTVAPTRTDGVSTYEHFSDNLIVIGASPKNCVRWDYVRRGLVKVRLSNETEAIILGEAPLTSRHAEIVDGQDVRATVNSEALHVAVIEKIIDADRAISIFFCLGQRGDVTWAAVEYLARSWRQLEREFGSGGFAVCVGFPEMNYSQEYFTPVRLNTVRE